MSLENRLCSLYTARATNLFSLEAEPMQDTKGKEWQVSEWSGKPQFNTRRSTPFNQCTAIWALQLYNIANLPSYAISTIAFST